jgi:hypothetical protein
MKPNLAFIICIVCVVIALCLFALVALQHNFPIFNASTQNGSYVDVTQNVGAADSRFLWNNDGLALIAQAFVLFAAAAATLGLLKNNGGEKNA